MGESHNLEVDTSYNWLNEFSGEILDAYSYYRMGKNSSKPTPPFEQLLRPGSQLLARFRQEKQPTLEVLTQFHPGRLFAVGILPLARALGYKDLILEGLNEHNPTDMIERSKDKAGDLLRLTSAMMLGMNIHGANPSGRYPTPTDIGDELFSTIKAVEKKDPEAKIIVYNGAVHNMTESFKAGTRVHEGLFSASDASEWTYAPRAKEMWGDRYGAIDLLGGNSILPVSHFKHMQVEAAKGAVTRFSHGVGQKTYVFK